MNTSITIWEIFAILLIHWIGDFILQTDWQAKNKSSSNLALSRHVLIYCFVSYLGYGIICYFENIDNRWVAPFLFMTFICHWITDYFTSRLNTKLYKENKIHEFFVSVGFDQILHYVQLILCFCWLLKK